MSNHRDRGDIDPFAAALIRRKARQLARRACFAEQDREDIEQELFLRLWQSRAAFDASRGEPHAFVAAVVNNAVADLLRRRQAARRASRPCSFAKVVVTDEGPMALAEVIGQPHYNARRGFRPLAPEEASLLAADVAAAIAGLPADLRALAECLMAGTLAEASRVLGEPRSTLQDKVRRLRWRFERAGLAVFLAHSPSFRGRLA